MKTTGGLRMNAEKPGRPALLNRRTHLNPVEPEGPDQPAIASSRSGVVDRFHSAPAPLINIT
jgi:hypothetical protein